MVLAMAMAMGFYSFVWAVQHPAPHNYKVHIEHLLPVINQKVIEIKDRVDNRAALVRATLFTTYWTNHRRKRETDAVHHG